MDRPAGIVNSIVVAPASPALVGLKFAEAPDGKFDAAKLAEPVVPVMKHIL